MHNLNDDQKKNLISLVSKRDQINESLVIIADDVSDIEHKIEENPDIEDLKVKVDAYNKAAEDYKAAQNNNNLLEIQMHNHKEKTSTLKKHDWFETSDVCKKCDFLSSAFESKEALPKLSKKHSEIQKKIDALNIEVENSKGYFEILTMVEDLHSKLEYSEGSLKFKELELAKIEDNIVHGRSILADLEASLVEYKKNEELIRFNKTAQKSLRNLAEALNSEQSSFKKLDRHISTCQQEIGSLSQKLQDLDDSISALDEVEKSFRQHSYLRDALSKNGIQLSIIKKVIPRINMEIKKILSNLPDLKVYMEIDSDSEDIIMYIEDSINKRHIELGSGMEKTMAAIAIRAALANISLLPKCNLFVIDEGFGTLDSDNLNQMNGILGYLKNMFDTVIIISHIDILQDICDHIITIDKGEDGYSKLKIS